jgi:hypothetical protein
VPGARDGLPLPRGRGGCCASALRGPLTRGAAQARSFEARLAKLEGK